MPENERSRGLTIDQTLARRAAQTFGHGPPERWFDLDGQRTTRELSEDLAQALIRERGHEYAVTRIDDDFTVITRFLGHDYTNEVDRPYNFELIVAGKTTDDEGVVHEMQLIDHFPNEKEAMAGHEFTAEALRAGYDPKDIIPRDLLVHPFAEQRVVDYERESREERMARQSGDPDYETIRQANEDWKTRLNIEPKQDAYESQLTQTDQRTIEDAKAIGEPPRQEPQKTAIDRDIFPKEMVTSEIRYGKNGTPYIPEVIGVHHVDEPRIEERVVLDKQHGEERQHTYGIAAGDYNIIGAWSADRERILDAVVAYHGVDLSSGERSILSTQMKPSMILDLNEAQAVTLEPGIFQALHEGSFHRRSEVAQKQAEEQVQEQAPQLSLHVA
jgi:hypothetical protein